MTFRLRLEGAVVILYGEVRIEPADELGPLFGRKGPFRAPLRVGSAGRSPDDNHHAREPVIFVHRSMTPGARRMIGRADSAAQINGAHGGLAEPIRCGNAERNTANIPVAHYWPGECFESLLVQMKEHLSVSHNELAEALIFFHHLERAADIEVG